MAHRPCVPGQATPKAGREDAAASVADLTATAMPLATSTGKNSELPLA
ncbi:hypothetical protein PCLA_02r0697 [Pseudomonas citronellolis]|nr:hypothetical protein PCLA_02r0697 [Pseudomonas citronellolis]